MKVFTGIIECEGKVKSIARGKSSFTVGIEASFTEALAIGESVSVNGVCLTAVRTESGVFYADVSPETMRRTSFSSLRTDSVVNLERAVMMGSRMGGHIVSGHIDGTARCQSFSRDENAVNVRVTMESSLGEFMVEKGSVALDGISLTIADVKKSGVTYIVTVSVIPHTWEHTTLSKKHAGDLLNVECDVIGKYVRHFTEMETAGIKGR